MTNYSLKPSPDADEAAARSAAARLLASRGNGPIRRRNRRPPEDMSGILTTDRKSVVGRLAGELRAALHRQLGPRRTAVQEALVAQIVQLRLRLAMADLRWVEQGGALSLHDSNRYLAWSNSYVRALRALGLDRVAADGVAPSLAEALAAGRLDMPVRGRQDGADAADNDDDPPPDPRRDQRRHSCRRRWFSACWRARLRRLPRPGPDAGGGTPLMDADIITAIHSPALWRPWFRDLKTWQPWFSFLRCMFGLPMTDADRATWTECTARTEPPPGGSNEAWLVVGRRGGKSQILAVIAVFLAVFRDWSAFTVPGESCLVQVIAVDRKQARIIHRYARAMLLQVPALKHLVASDTGDIIELTNNITIEITTNSFRSVRGYTIVAALLDEVAFWRSDESTTPDSETLIALRPAMATVPNAMLLAASSPYAKRGILYEAFRDHYGKDGGPIIWRASTRAMNPTISQKFVDDAMERDPAAALAEYMAEFRNDIESFVSREVVDAATIPGRYELPPFDRASYVAFVDPSGGSANSMTLAIAHRDGDRGILDAVREVRPPFSPEQVVKDFVLLLKHFRITSVTGDRYAGEWPRERFREHGISYVPAEKPKSDIYREMLPLLNSGKLELLDHPRLAIQLATLERRTARPGRTRSTTSRARTTMLPTA